MKKERIISTIAIIIVIILCTISVNKCVKDNVLNDRVSDAEHLFNLYSTIKNDYNTVIKGKDSIIDILANTLDTLTLKKPTVVYLSTQTYIDTVLTTHVIKDTINNTVMECYSFDLNNKWISMVGSACADSTKFKLMLYEDFVISAGTRRSLFNPTYDIFVTSNNPYVRVNDIGSIQFKPRPTKIGLGIQAGYGVSRSGISPYIGIGISYNFIRL